MIVVSGILCATFQYTPLRQATRGVLDSEAYSHPDKEILHEQKTKQRSIAA